MQMMKSKIFKLYSCTFELYTSFNQPQFSNKDTIHTNQVLAITTTTSTAAAHS